MMHLTGGFTELIYKKNVYQLFTYIVGTRIALFWLDTSTEEIISQGFSSLPEWKIHSMARRSAKKHGCTKILGHNIQTLKNRIHGNENLA